MRLSENPGRIEAWVYRHASWLVAVLLIVVLPLAAVTGWLVIDEIKQGKQLRGVSVAGPCRAFGIQNDECQKQARRIFAACYVQQDECWNKYGLPRRRIPDREVASAEEAEGGGALQTGSNPGTQQPGPRGDGGDQGGRSERGEGRPPKAPSAGAPEAPPAGAPSSVAPSPANDSGQSPKGNGSAPPVDPPGLVEDVTGTAAGAVEQAGKDVEGTVKGAGETADCVLRGSC